MNTTVVISAPKDPQDSASHMVEEEGVLIQVVTRVLVTNSFVPLMAVVNVASTTTVTNQLLVAPVFVQHTEVGVDVALKGVTSPLNRRPGSA